jgi:nucleoid DNA-binding protein
MATYDVIGLKKEGFTDEQIALAIANAEGKTDVVSSMLSEGFTPQQVISSFNKTGATPFETFKQAAKQEVGSEITGIRQLFGAEPTDTAEESLTRQMESENPLSGLAGRVVGGLVNPSTLLPGAAFGKGAKALIASGAATGGISGFVQPQYTEEDLSRAGSTVLGAAGGATIVGALLGGAKGVQKVINKLTNKVEDIPVSKLDPEIHVPTEEPRMQESVSISGQAIPDVVKVVDNEAVPLMRAIEDAETRTRIEDDLSRGNFTSFFNEVPFRNTEIPVFKIEDALGATNPYRQANIDAKIASGQKVLNESEKMMEVITKMYSSQLRGELDDRTLRELFPADVAEQLAMLRKREEVLPSEVTNALAPLAQKSAQNIQVMSELFEQGTNQGMKREEMIEMFAPEIAAYRPLFSLYGSASNAAAALQAQKQIKQALGFGVPELRKYLNSKGKVELESFGDFMDAVSAIRKSQDPFLNKDVSTIDAANKALNNPKWNDKFGEFVVNSYISGLATLSVNAMSGVGKGVLLSAERLLQAINPLSAVKIGELIPAYKGLIQGTMEGLAFAKEGFIRGTPLDADLTDVTGRNMRGSIGTSPESTRFAQIAGQVIRTPGKASVGIDEFFKSAFRRMELNAQAYRIADSGKYGDPETVFRAIKNIDTSTPNWKNNILASPDLANLSDAVKERLIGDVTRFAKQATFQGDLGKMGNKFTAFRAEHPGLAWLIPFVKTPINIMKDAISYTPGGAFMLREVVGYNKGTPIYRAVPKDVAIARTAIGLGVTASIGSMLNDGMITGSYPNDPGERAKMIAANIPEYSVKIGDRWVSYARLEPLATVVGSAVDGLKGYVDYRKKPSYDEDKGKDLAVDIVSGVTKNIASKTFLEGISNLLQAAHEPARYGEAFVNSFAGLVVPAIVAAPARYQDPNARVVTSFGEAVQNRIPDFGLGLPIPSRQELPIASNILGGERRNPAAGFAALTGLQTAPVEQTKLQSEIARLDFKYTPVDKELRGVKLSGEEQALYQKTASDFADRYLNNLVQSPAYDGVKDSMKNFILKQTMRQARAAATDAMFGYKMRDPEYRKMYLIQQLKKKGVEE